MGTHKFTRLHREKHFYTWARIPRSAHIRPAYRCTRRGKGGKKTERLADKMKRNDADSVSFGGLCRRRIFRKCYLASLHCEVWTAAGGNVSSRFLRFAGARRLDSFFVTHHTAAQPHYIASALTSTPPFVQEKCANQLLKSRGSR